MADIPLFILEGWPDVDKRTPGAMWRYQECDEPGRESWWIVLPNDHPDLGTPGHPGRLAWRTTDRAWEPPHQQWEVTGTAPLLTVRPSIDVVRMVFKDDAWVREGSYWHGYITAGILHDA